MGIGAEGAHSMSLWKMSRVKVIHCYRKTHTCRCS